MEKIAQYPYTLGSVIENREIPVTCTEHSKRLEELDYENIQEMIGVELKLLQH